MPIRVFWGDVIGDAIRSTGYYEPITARVILSALQPTDTFFDVGANIGQFSLLASPGAEAVHSFEPNPSTFRVLEQNVTTNRLANIRVSALALSDSEGTTILNLPSAQNVGSASLRPPEDAPGLGVKILTTTVDQYCLAHGIEQINLMKIDVEGAELQVLSGAERIIRGLVKPILIVEFSEKRQSAFGSSCAELQAFLTGRGYTLYRIGERGPQPYDASESESFFNVLAIPQSDRTALKRIEASFPGSFVVEHVEQ